MDNEKCIDVKELCFERFGRDKERLNALEITMTRITDLIAAANTATVQANLTLDRIAKQTEDHEGRIRKIESRRGQIWDKVVVGALAAAVGAFIGWIINGGGAV